MMSNSTILITPGSEDHENSAGSAMDVNRFAFKVFGSTSFRDDDPIAFKICNVSSLCFFAVQAVYASFLLYRLIRKTEKKPKRSCSLITATVLIIYSSIVLSVLFGLTNLSIKAQSTSGEGKGDIYLGLYLIFCRDLPFSLSFIKLLIAIESKLENDAVSLPSWKK